MYSMSVRSKRSGILKGEGRAPIRIQGSQALGL